MFNTQNKPAYHPALQLIILLLYAFTFAFIFSGFGIVAAKIFLNYPIEQIVKNMSTDTELIRLMQGFVSTGVFIAAPLFYYFIFLRNDNVFKRVLDNPSLLHLGLGIISLFAVQPLIEILYNWNQQLSLPAFAQNIESWMRASEDSAEILTKKLLEMPTTAELISNILVVALIPAIGEELMFRGIIQQIFQKKYSYHVAIWISAILFSAMHMQFYGFLPRLALGALFGYLLVFSGSILVPITAHFINNGAQVIITYMQQHKIIALTEEELETTPLIIKITFTALFTMIMYFFYQKRALSTPQIPSRDRSNIDALYPEIKPQQQDDWITVYETEAIHLAEIVKSNLEANDIEAIILNHRDSSYQNFGTVKVNVRLSNKNTALALMEVMNLN